MSDQDKSVVYLDDALTKISTKLSEAATITLKQVLPGPRGKLMICLTEADKMIKAVQELADRSGFGKKLGFIVNPDSTIQPVVVQEKQPDPVKVG